MTARKSYRVTVGTCDDANTVEMLLTEEQADAYQYLGSLIDQARTYECGLRVLVEEAE